METQMQMQRADKPLTGDEIVYLKQDGRIRRTVLRTLMDGWYVPPVATPIPIQVPVYIPISVPTVKGVIIPVGSSLSGSIQKTVSIAGPKAGDVIDWSYAKGSPALAALVPGMAYCLENGKVTFCFAVTGSLGLSLGSSGSVTVNIAYHAP